MKRNGFLIKQAGEEKYFVHIGKVVDAEVSKSLAQRCAFKTMKHAQQELQFVKENLKRQSFEIVTA